MNSLSCTDRILQTNLNTQVEALYKQGDKGTLCKRAAKHQTEPRSACQPVPLLALSALGPNTNTQCCHLCKQSNVTYILKAREFLP